MLRHTLTAAMLAYVATGLLAKPVYANEPHWELECDSGYLAHCSSQLVDEDTSAGQEAGAVAGSSGSWGDVVDSDPCYYRPLAMQPAAGDAAWGGNDPGEGRLWQAFCPESLMVAAWSSDGSNMIGTVAGGDPYFVGDADSPAAAFAGVDPMVLVSRARGAFDFPVPEPVFGPRAGELAVKVPVWFAVAEFAPVVQTASAGRFTASVSAELVSTSWLPGEPVDPELRPGQWVGPVVCDGPGVVFVAGMDPWAPPCGYTYVWRSLPERTGGVGRWVLTVTNDYRVVFEVVNTQTGEVVRSGADTVQTQARVLMPIREWRGVLGDPNGPAPEIQQIYPEVLPPSA